MEARVRNRLNERDVVEMADIKLNNYRVEEVFSNRGNEGKEEKGGNCHERRSSFLSFPFAHDRSTRMHNKPHANGYCGCWRARCTHLECGPNRWQ